MNTSECHKIRWMKKKDLRYLKKIDSNLNNEFLNNFISRKNSFCYVLEFENEIAGFIFFKYYENSIKVIKIIISENHRMKGFGKLLLSIIKNKLNKKRNKINAFVSEWDLDSQLFFKKCEFLAISKVDYKEEIFLKFSYEDSFI